MTKKISNFIGFLLKLSVLLGSLTYGPMALANDVVEDTSLQAYVDKAVAQINLSHPTFVVEAHFQSQAPKELWDRFQFRLQKDGRMHVSYTYSRATIQSRNDILSDIFMMRMLTYNEFNSANAKTWLRMFEYFYNAQNGDAGAKHLISFNLKQFPEYYLKLTPEQYALMPDLKAYFTSVGKTAPATEDFANLLTELRDYYERQIQFYLKEHNASEKRKAKDWERWKKQTPTLGRLDNAPKKLDDLIRANDRHGVRKLLENYLPWPLMAPYEKAAWKTWLENIEKRPTKENSQIVFRGVNYDTDIPFWSKDGKPGFMSTLLTKNQGNYNRRLRSLSTRRYTTGADGISPGLKDNPSVLITNMIWSHSENPLASAFLSFSRSMQVAGSFAGDYDEVKEKPKGGFLAIRVPSTRLIPNAMSRFDTEFELLLPMIVFPEDVVYYKETPSPAFFSKYESDLVKEVLPALSPEDRALAEKSMKLYQDHKEIVNSFSWLFQSVAEKSTGASPLCEGLFR